MFKLNIKTIRKKLGLTQGQLAKELNLSQSYVSKIEKEGFERETSPSLDLIEEFAKVFRCCPALIINFDCETCALHCTQEEKDECYSSTLNVIKEAIDKKIANDNEENK